MQQEAATCASFGPADFHLLPRMKEAGFDGIEVPIFGPHALDPVVPAGR